MNDNNIAINVENIAKRYRLGLKETQSDSAVKDFYKLLKSPLDNYRKYKSLYNFDNTDSDEESDDILWALRDVSFKVNRGDVVGIIGRNGAGKSTLLKILSRITPPTSGKIEIRGRISSLLEVGTGFHPELTGRENVYLNGTILGMTKQEVERKFEEIVEFSGVGKFLDTPVKRYSSGMRVRLAFAVAAHLEPEILIVDEVLAVGDAEFQRKCLSKMEDVGNEGRTVLFVSHNMPAVTRLCKTGILLNAGTVVKSGHISEVVSDYLNSGTDSPASRTWLEPSEIPGGEFAKLNSIRVINDKNETAETIEITNPVGIEMEYEVVKSGAVLLPHFHLHNEDGIILFATLDQDPQWRKRPRPEGKYRSTVWIPGNYLAEGMIYIDCCILTLNPNIVQFLEKQTIAFHIVENDSEDSARGDYMGKLTGVVRPLLDWQTKTI